MARITIVATGGIRAPTALELLDRFVGDGHEVRLLASHNALRFLWAHLFWRPAQIGKFLRRFRPQIRETLAYFAHKKIGVPHIAEGKWADIVLMAPATCNSIGKLVAGLGDTYPLLVVRAVPRTKRVIVVPSMNPEMWFDPHFQRNVDLLNATDKYQVLCPSRGQMASGDFGIGAQAPFEDIIAATYGALGLLDRTAETALLRADASVPWGRDHPPPDATASEAIVLVDEDRPMREEIAGALSRANPGRKVLQFDQPRQAMEWLAQNRAALVLSDLGPSSGASGYDLVEFLRKPGSFRECQVVVTSTRNRREVGAERLARQDVLFLPKPLNVPFTVGMLAGLIGGNRRAPPTATITLQPGDVLFAEGDSGTEVYMVESGALQVVRRSEGREKPLHAIRPGDMIGEMAFLTGAKRSATVIAVEPSQLVRIELHELHDYLDRQPPWLRKMIDTVVERLRETSTAVVDREP